MQVMQTLSINPRNFERDRVSYIDMVIFKCKALSMKSLKYPDVVALGGAGFLKLFSIEVRKFTVNNKISWIHLLVVPVVPFYCIIIALSEFVPIET